MRLLILLSTLTLAAAAALQTPSTPDGPFRFETQQIRENFGVGYAVTVADVNRDGKPDVLAISGTQLVWFENPSWQGHVVLDGQTPKDNVTLAPHDIDRDGRLDVALGATWKPSDTNGGGTLHWASPAATAASWTLHDITSEPTLHRIRWANIDGAGDPELIVAPLHGRGTAPPEWAGPGPRLLALRVPKNPAKEPWFSELIDDTLHIVHNFAVLDFDGDGDDELVAASREGLHLLERGSAGAWTRTRLGDVNAGEVKVGRLGGVRALAVIEPWHGTTLAIYREPGKQTRGPWTRQVIDETLTGGHAIGWADFDGDGSDELVAGWRDKEVGVALYRITSATERPARVMIDAGGMAAEDLTVADLDGDKRPDIIASGRRTANVKIYWNRTPR
jgi:hypothetical protein